MGLNWFIRAEKSPVVVESGKTSLLELRLDSERCLESCETLEHFLDVSEMGVVVVENESFLFK